jgi:hypothetical protein
MLALEYRNARILETQLARSWEMSRSLCLLYLLGHNFSRKSKSSLYRKSLGYQVY